MSPEWMHVMKGGTKGTRNNLRDGFPYCNKKHVEGLEGNLHSPKLQLSPDQPGWQRHW